MSHFWIRKNIDGPTAGPFTLQELRGLRTGGFLPSDTEISFMPFDGFFVLENNPALVEAIARPEVYDYHEFVSYPGRAESEVAEESADDQEEPPVLGVAEFYDPSTPPTTIKLCRTRAPAPESIVPDDAAPANDAREVLRLANEGVAELPLSFPPWYRNPSVRNAFRTLIGMGFAAPALYYGMRHVEASPYTGVPLLALGALLLVGTLIVVYLVAPSRWNVS